MIMKNFINLANNFKSQKGFGLLELIVAMGLFMIVVVSGAGGILKSYSLNRLADEEVGATLYATEGIEAAKSIANQDWANLSAGTYGVDSSGGGWAFSGSSNQSLPFTRVLTISDVYRDSQGNIVTSGGTLDPNTYRVNSTVSWDFTPTRNNNINLTSYLSNFKKEIASGNLVVDYSAANISGGNKELQGITIENIGTDDIIIEKVTVSWVVNTTSLIEEVVIDGSTLWKHNGTGTPTGRQPSGTELDMDDYLLSPGAGVIPIDSFRFDSNMSSETQFTIVFQLSDGTFKTVVIDLAGGSNCGATQADDFSINVAGANLGGGNKDLQGITVQNISLEPTCNVVIDKVMLTWTNTRLIQEVNLNGTKIWAHNGAGTPDGKQVSGTLLDSDDYVITPAAGVLTFDKFRFDGNMINNIFGITFTLGDGSTKSVTGIAP